MSDTTTTAPAMLPGDASNLRVTIMGEGEAPQVEFLNVADSTQLSHSADVQQYPSGEEFAREVEGHQKAIADLQLKLDQKSFDSRTGQPKGHAYEGDARRHLELQLNNRKAALEFTGYAPIRPPKPVPLWPHSVPLTTNRVTTRPACMNRHGVNC
jgi:hypothetical protein